MIARLSVVSVSKFTELSGLELITYSHNWTSRARTTDQPERILNHLCSLEPVARAAPRCGFRYEAFAIPPRRHVVRNPNSTRFPKTKILTYIRR